MTIRTILVDDEPLAIQGLELRLEPHEDVEIIDTCSNGREAIRSIKTHKPDLVFLDIQMPGFDGFSVIQGLMEVEPPLFVFVTAYSDHALRAFEAQAVDYLMKPVDPARLERALERVRDHLAGGGRASGGADTPHVEEFWVPDHNGLVRISASDIHRVTAERDYMRLHVGTRSWLIHRTIGKLEDDLDPALFIRVHRSVILRRDTIIGLFRDDVGHWTARLSDGGEQRIGRSYVDDVKKFAGR